MTVPEKVRYWEVAIARAKRNPTGCLCRAVEDLLGVAPNYGHAGKLVKQHGRMVVWRQVTKSLLHPPEGDLWEYVGRALGNNSAQGQGDQQRPSWHVDPDYDYADWEEG